MQIYVNPKLEWQLRAFSKQHKVPMSKILAEALEKRMGLDSPEVARAVAEEVATKLETQYPYKDLVFSRVDNAVFDTNTQEQVEATPEMLKELKKRNQIQ